METLDRGQSLFELVVAIAISALIVVAMVSLTVASIKSSTFSKNKSLAASYAQQATEWLRGQRDASFGEFQGHVQNAGSSAMCLNDLVWTNIGCSGQTISGTPFQRTVAFPDSGNPSVIEADVTVSWTDAGGMHNVTSATNFSNWK